jgi:hypothetical protein
MALSQKIVRQACAQRVAEHASAQRARGLVRSSVWIPTEARGRLARYAAQLRAEAGVPLPTDPPPPKKAAQPKKRSTSAEKPKKRRSPSKERRYQRRKAERAARSEK